LRANKSLNHAKHPPTSRQHGPNMPPTTPHIVRNIVHVAQSEAILALTGATDVGVGVPTHCMPRPRSCAQPRVSS